MNSDFYDLNFKNFPVGILISNKDRIVYQNDRMEEYHITCLNDILPFDLPDISTNTQITIPTSNRPIYINIIPYKIKNESTHLITFKKSPDQEEQLQNLERKLIQLSEDVYRSTELFKCIESEINLGIIKTSQDGIVEYQNEIFQKMSEQFIIGKHITELIPEESQKRQVEYIIQEKASGIITFKMNVTEAKFVWMKFKISYNEHHGFVITAKDVTYQEETIRKLLEVKTEVKKIVDEDFRKA
jgi:PAS domain S-box-containing protein